jgi:elongation factor 1-alpha
MVAADTSNVTGLKRLNVCFIGHVDSGKSTAVGNLAYLLNAIDKRTMDKYEKEAALNNKASFAFAYVTDRTAAEKERGITITTTLINVKTSKFDVNILDCPGHKDFIKNMVSGAAQSDVGVVIVPSSGFESCVGEGGMLKSHITISAVLGCKKLIVCVNKMDEVPEASRKMRFEEIKIEMERIVKKTHSDKTPILIPISAFKGINLVNKGEKFEWFDGWTDPVTGQKIFTLEEALDSQEEPPRMVDKPLRMPITGIHKIRGVGTVYTGRVDTGFLKPEQSIVIQPAGATADVKTVEIHKKTQENGVPAGENCGVSIKNIRGDINAVEVGNIISSSKDCPAKVPVAALAKIIVIDKPKGLAAGYTPVMDIGPHHVPVKIARILYKISHNKEKTESPQRVGNGESFVAVIVPQKQVVMESMKDFPNLGRFALRDSNIIVAIGSIDRVLSEEELNKEFGISTAAPAKGAEAAKKKK